MVDVVRATKVDAVEDWQGVYIDGDLVEQDHAVGLEWITLDDGIAIDSVDRQDVHLDRLGMRRLPDTLSDLNHYIELADEIEADTAAWTSRVEDAFAAVGDNPTKETLCVELELTRNELCVVEGVLGPSWTSQRRTAVGGEPVFQRVKDEADDGELTYALLDE